ECVGSVEIPADQEPGDHSAEAAAAEAPLVQHVQVAAAPVCRDESEPGDEAEQDDEDDEGGPVDHVRSPARSVLEAIDDADDGGTDQDPKELVPIEERDARPVWLGAVVPRHPKHGDERDDQQQPCPGDWLCRCMFVWSHGHWTFPDSRLVIIARSLPT